MTIQEWAEAIMWLNTVYGGNKGHDYAMATHAFVSDLDATEVMEALHQHVAGKDGSYYPAPSRILAIAKPRPSAEALVLHVIAGTPRPPGATDRDVRTAKEALGGDYAIRTTGLSDLNRRTFAVRAALESGWDAETREDAKRRTALTLAAQRRVSTPTPVIEGGTAA